MRCSLIANHLVFDTKGGNLGYVSGLFDFNTLEEFAYLATRAHIAPAAFRDNKRDGDHFISTDFLCWDFDDGKHSAVRVHEQLTARYWSHILLASKNHLKEKGDGKGWSSFHSRLPAHHRPKRIQVRR